MRSPFGQRRFRHYLEENDFVLVGRERWHKHAVLERSIDRYSREAYEMRQTMDGLNDQIKTLEAEVEAHKRIEAALAERVIAMGAA